MAHAVTLFHLFLAVFPDAPDFHWGRFVTQVPDAEMEQHLSVDDITHEPFACSYRHLEWFSDALGHAQHQRIRRPKHVSMSLAILVHRVHIFIHHRILAYSCNLWRVRNICVESVGATSGGLGWL